MEIARWVWVGERESDQMGPDGRGVVCKTLPVNKHLSTRSPESLPPVNNLSSSSRGSRGLCSVSDCPTFVVVAFVVDEDECDEEGSSDEEKEEEVEEEELVGDDVGW